MAELNRHFFLSGRGLHTLGGLSREVCPLMEVIDDFRYVLPAVFTRIIADVV